MSYTMVSNVVLGGDTRSDILRFLSYPTCRLRQVGPCIIGLKDRVVSGIVYEDMHYEDVLGSIARVGYCMPVSDFNLVL